MQYSTLTTLALAAGAQAANHVVTVGANNALTFTPATVKAAVGDTVTYNFVSQNHSVVQGNFAQPCQPAANAFFSGFYPVTVAAAAGGANNNAAAANNANAGKKQKNNRATGGANTFTVNVANTNPMFFYCSQATHCQMGMVGAINPPANNAGGQTVQAYAAASKNAKNNVSPAAVQGGTVSQSAATKANAAKAATAAKAAKGGAAANNAAGQAKAAANNAAGQAKAAKQAGKNTRDEVVAVEFSA